jgi:phage host-nuclease inhibitor protein Gam
MAKKAQPAPVTSRPELIPIESVARLDELIAEVGALDQKGADLDTQCKAELQPLIDKWQRLRVVSIDGQDVPLVDRRELLFNSIMAYCVDNKSALLQGDSKSLELTHGTISWRAVPRYVAIIPGKKDKEWIAESAKKLIAIGIAPEASRPCRSTTTGKSNPSTRSFPPV